MAGETTYTCNTKWLKAKIGFTLTDQLNWQLTFQSLPNALDYKIYYKDELKLENYPLLRAFKRDAITMCRFCICNHHLYQKMDVTSIPRNDRICNKYWVFKKKNSVVLLEKWINVLPCLNLHTSYLYYCIFCYIFFKNIFYW